MSTIAVGDEVALPQGHRAILRWIGRIPGRPPVEYAGVEVLGPDAERLGKHSGAYQGQQFFETSRPGTGLFVSYTQLVGANVKSARVETPRPARSAAMKGMSPIAYDAVSPSPRYHKPPMMRAGPQTPGPAQAPAVHTPTPHTPAPQETAVAPEPADDAPARSMAGQLEQLRAERAAERKAFESRRAEFRETLRIVNDRLAQYASDYEARVAEIRDEYEAKLKSARRSSSLMVSAGGSEVQEQRLALAAMQNKLVAERTEKQHEIDKLKRELAHVRQITGGADDLESLVADLSSMEQQLKDMRSKVDQMDALQRELEATRTRNAELELAVKSGASHEHHRQDHAQDAVSRAEFARLEQALEMRLLRESELEAQNEQLRAELEQLRASEASKPDQAALSEPGRRPDSENFDFGSASSSAPAASARSSTESRAPTVADSVVATTPKPAADDWELTTETPVTSQPALGTRNGAISPLAMADESNTSQFADLAAGRKDWCSLCERQGHSAIDCPFI